MSDIFEISLVVGNDNGNSEHDMYINGVPVAQPNVYSKVRKLPRLLDELNPKYIAENIEKNLIVSIDSPSVDPGIYYVGNFALNSGEKVRNIEVGVDNNKFNSQLVIINTLAQIAGFAAKEAYRKDPALCKDIKVKVDMSTALPINQYSKSNALVFSNKFMSEDKHKVTVYLASIRVNVEIIFEYVKTIPEGVTTVHALQNIDEETLDILNEFNKKYGIKANADYFKDKRILHVAIGEGTSEYPITNGLSFNPNFIRGSNNGIGHAIDKSLDEFKNELGLLDYSRQKYSEILRNEGHKYYPIATDIIEGYIEEQAEEILHKTKTEIQRANNEIDIIAVYGGGSIPMRKQLESKLDSICDNANIKLLYVPAKYAVMLEAKGLYCFASGPIFKALKDKAANK